MNIVRCLRGLGWVAVDSLAVGGRKEEKRPWAGGMGIAGLEAGYLIFLG
jgi:hypothetical protein